MKKNPFRVTFLTLVIICFVMFSGVFLFVLYENYKSKVFEIYQQKADVILQDFETQLQLMENISLEIATNYKFHPYYFKNRVDKEWDMMQAFTYYQYSPLVANDYFLWYGDSYIYRSTNSTLSLDVYLKNQFQNPEERDSFTQELYFLLKNSTELWDGCKILSFQENMYILSSFRTSNSNCNYAVLTFVVDKKDLLNRFQFVSSGFEGNFSLYQKDSLLYSYSEVDTINKVLTTTSEDGGFTLQYEPSKESLYFTSQIYLYGILILMNLCLLVAIACIWAEKTYKPLLNLSEKYQEKLPNMEQHNVGALEKLDQIVDSIIAKNEEISKLNTQRQRTNKNYFLQILLQNSSSSEALAYMDETDIVFPNPYFMVITFSFENDASMTDDFLKELANDLEKVSDEENKDFVYSCYNLSKKIINVICNFEVLDKKEFLSDVLIGIVENNSHFPIVGLGGAYFSLSGISASWMESINSIFEQKNNNENNLNYSVHDNEYMQRIINALETGNEKFAIENLNNYVDALSKQPMSLLVMQYVFTNFMSEIINLSKKYQLDLPIKSTSLLLASQSIGDFELAAKKMIRDYCIRYTTVKTAKDDELLQQIYDYINNHYRDYNLSLENVARAFNVSTTLVRQATLKFANKTYKDYIIFLRIECAKKLLLEENLSINEIAFMIGYGNGSYFVRLFREVVGITPAKYRRNSLENNN